MAFIQDRRQEQRFLLSTDTVRLALITSTSKSYAGEPLTFSDYSRSGFAFLSSSTFLVGTFLTLQMTKSSGDPIVLNVLVCNRKKVMDQFRYGVFSDLGECEVVKTLS